MCRAAHRLLPPHLHPKPLPYGCGLPVGGPQSPQLSPMPMTEAGPGWQQPRIFSEAVAEPVRDSVLPHPAHPPLSMIPSDLSPAATLEGTSACVGGKWYVNPRPSAPLKGPRGPWTPLVALPQPGHLERTRGRQCRAPHPGHPTSSPREPCEAGAVIIPTLQMGKPRHRKGRKSSLGPMWDNQTPDWPSPLTAPPRTRPPSTLGPHS